MVEADARSSSRLARVLALVGLFNAATIVLLYAGLPLFGPLNDIGVGSAALLQAVLAWRLQAVPFLRVPRLALLAAGVGALGAALGSMLVVLNITGWFLASLVTILGYAFLGIWVVAVNRQARIAAGWPLRVTAVGQLIGAIMCVGFVAALALPSGVDDPRTAPWYVWVSYANGVGWFILLPLWNLWLARLLLEGEDRGARR